MSSLRWAFWGLLAALIDLCPMLCGANVTKYSNTPFIWKKGTRTEIFSTGIIHKEIPKQEFSELALMIANEINNNLYGDKPSVRKVMEEHQIRHPETKLIFDQLIDMNIVKREGQRFIRIKNPSNAQEQSA